MIVHLTEAEVQRAADMGVAQVIRAMFGGMHHRDGSRFPAWQSQITGFLGEMAVSKAMGLPFAPDLTGFKRVADVGMYEVRSTSLPDGKLLVKPADRMTRRFLHVRVLVPDCVIVGWIRGFDAQDVGLWNQNLYGGAWLVADAHLRPFTINSRLRIA